jgi:tRNA(fMet)-specific endonuclease VapC
VTLDYLLDTNVLVAWLRGRRTPDPARFDAARGRSAVSTVTVMELEYGCELARDPDAARADTSGLLALMAVVPFDRAAAAQAGRVRAALRRAGTPIGPHDALIAGHALALGLTVVTRNTREFARVPGLRVEDWAGPTAG